MKAIEPSLVKDNFIEIIGKEWMLVSAGDKDKFNMMTLYPRVCRCEGSFHAVLFRRRA